MNPLNISPDTMINNTPLYKTRVISEDGKRVTFYNKTHAFQLRALPATVGLRFLHRYPIEAISWCYLGMPVKKLDLLTAASMFAGSNSPELENRQFEWESLDTIDLGWKLFVENKCVFVAPVEKMNIQQEYTDIGALIGAGLYNDSDHDLLDLMTLSTCVIRMTLGCFFLNYMSYLQDLEKWSSEQEDTFGQTLQNTFLEMLTLMKNSLKETGSTFMQEVRTKKMNKLKSKTS